MITKKGTLLSAFFLSFTFFFFGPLELILSNRRDFWFEIPKVLPTFILFTALFFVVLSVISLCASTKISIILFTLTFSTALLLYIEGNYLLQNYGVMDGQAIDWSSFNVSSIIDAGIWIIIIGIIVLAAKFKWSSFYKISCILAGIIIGIELVTLVVLGVTTSSNIKNTFFLTDKNQFQLSKDQNVVVFLADGFDAVLMDRILEEEPEIAGQLEGFTYFSDTCGTSLWTEESIVTVLTGEQCRGDLSYSDNIELIYKESPLYPSLLKEKYEIGIYEPNPALISPNVAPHFENYESGASRMQSPLCQGEVLYRMVAFKYFPKYLKKHFWYSTSDLESLKDPTHQYRTDDIGFYQKLMQEGISLAPDERKRYKFYYLNGPHSPFIMSRDCKYTSYSDETNLSDQQYEQALGTVKIYLSFIAQLKNLGIYDNTSIFFTADHGWDVRSNPMLMVKPRNSSGPLTVSEAPVSMINDYMPTVINQISAINTSDTLFDIKENDNRARPFYVYSINSDRSYNRRTTYRVTGKTNKASSYSFESNMLRDLINTYTLGHELQFNTMFCPYLNYGFDETETSNNGKWSTSHQAEIVLPLDKEKDVLTVSFEVSVIFGNSQQVICKINNSIVFNKTLKNIGTYQFNVNKENLQDGHLILDFEFPDASSPHQSGTGSDTRLLSIRLKSLKVE